MEIEDQFKSKDMTFYLRLTLKDQALSAHRSEYPQKVNTYPKICSLLKLRFDTRTKMDTNSKVLHRLTFNTFISQAGGSITREFNALVLRI